MVTASRPSASASATAPATMVSRLSRSRSPDLLLLVAMSANYTLYTVAWTPSRWSNRTAVTLFARQRVSQRAGIVHLAPRNEIANRQGVEEFDEHLLAVDAVWEAGLPDFDRGRNVVPGAVEDEVRKFPGHQFMEGSRFEAMQRSDLIPVALLARHVIAEAQLLGGCVRHTEVAGYAGE